MAHFCALTPRPELTPSGSSWLLFRAYRFWAARVTGLATSPRSIWKARLQNPRSRVSLRAQPRGGVLDPWSQLQLGGAEAALLCPRTRLSARSCSHLTLDLQRVSKHPKQRFAVRPAKTFASFLSHLLRTSGEFLSLKRGRPVPFTSPSCPQITTSRKPSRMPSLHSQVPA